MSKEEILRRNATLLAISEFEKVNGLPNAVLQEIQINGQVSFVGTAPDGRQYGMGYIKPE